jgi:hypothetical protein
MPRRCHSQAESGVAHVFIFTRAPKRHHAATLVEGVCAHMHEGEPSEARPGSLGPANGT